MCGGGGVISCLENAGGTVSTVLMTFNLTVISVFLTGLTSALSNERIEQKLQGNSSQLRKTSLVYGV